MHSIPRRPGRSSYIQAMGAAFVALWLTASCSSSESGNPATQDTDGKVAAATTDTRLPGEQLQIVPPNGWQLSASSNRGQFRRARYVRVPAAVEGVADTTAPQPVESLTFEYMDPAGLPNPIAFLETMSAEQADRCEQFSSTGISAAIENGYASAVRLLSCPYRKVNKSSTVSLAKAIAGNDGFYLIVFEKRVKARRNDSGWSTDHVSEADIASWSLYLRSTTVCDAQRSEHPCS